MRRITGSSPALFRAHAGEIANIYVGVEVALELALDRLSLSKYRLTRPTNRSMAMTAISYRISEIINMLENFCY